jgi:hypothetical protein
MTRTEPLFRHVLALTDGVGIFEHARLRLPRVEHGYCVDDVARALVAVCRDQPSAAEQVQGRVLAPAVMSDLAEVYLGFLEGAQAPDGAMVNRRDAHGTRHGPATLEDCWGRAVWAFGTAAARSRDATVAERAADAFLRSAVRRSPWTRSMAFAGLGAAEMMRVDPAHEVARALLHDAAASVGPFRGDREWPWPEPRLTYANAVLADVVLAAGDSLNDPRLVDEGLEMLGWLLGLQHAGRHLSLTPHAGWFTGEDRPGFDQQPIEAASLADACARAFELTGDTRWSDAVDLCAAWFFGRNDARTSLYDVGSGGCCDGLERDGRNENQGAESTLALVTTLQHSARLAGTLP